jgi:hypothetical protein
MKDNIPGSIFYNTDLDSVIILSVLEFLNITTIWLYFDFGSATGNNPLDVILGIGIFFILNYFVFLHKQRYKNLILKSKNKSQEVKTIAQLGTLAYVVLTILFFYLAISHKSLA